MEQNSNLPNVTSSKDSRVHGNFNASLGSGWQAAKCLTSLTTELLVVDGSGASNHHTRGSVVGVDVVTQIVLGQGSNILLWSKNGAAQASSLEGGGVQVVKDKFLLLLVDLGHLSQNHITFSLNGTILELRVEQNVGENLKSSANILLEDLGKVDSLLTRCVSVPKRSKGLKVSSYTSLRVSKSPPSSSLPLYKHSQMTTHVFNLHFQLLLSSLGCSLEGHVLQKVSSSIVLSSLVTRTSIDPDTYSRSFGTYNSLRGHS